MVVIAAGLISIASTPAMGQQPTELAYDDGHAETSWYKTATGVGGFDAVRFTSPFDFTQIVAVKYYIRDKPGTFNVLILDSGRSSVFEKAVTPTATGWFRVDLSSDNVLVKGEFYGAMKWTVAEAPQLGADESKPDGRSFFVDADGTWSTYREVKLSVDKQDKDGDLMIRTEVIQGSVPVTLGTEPNNVGVTVDGTLYKGTDLPKTFTWDPGSTHTMQVEATVEGEPGVRYVFVQWSDGSKETSRTVTATDILTLTATFKTQFELKIVSAYGSPQGAGWYDSGTDATFTVAPTVPDDGVLGALGGKRIFQGWKGDVAASSASATIKMNGPKTVEAEWTADDSQAYMILGGIGAAVAVIIVVALLMMRRRGTPAKATAPSIPVPPPMPSAPVAPAPRPTATPAPQGFKYCVHCGATIPKVVIFCQKCGKKQ